MQYQRWPKVPPMRLIPVLTGNADCQSEGVSEIAVDPRAYGECEITVFQLYTYGG